MARPYIEEVLQMLLKGMSDDVSSCRDTAFKARTAGFKGLKRSLKALKGLKSLEKH